LPTKRFWTGAGGISAVNYKNGQEKEPKTGKGFVAEKPPLSTIFYIPLMLDAAIRLVHLGGSRILIKRSTGGKSHE
jgi:hypothetical protein